MAWGRRPAWVDLLVFCYLAPSPVAPYRPADEVLVMLADSDATATVAVKNLPAAAQFYEGKLGFKKVGGGEMQVLIYQSGKSTLMVYESQFAGTNKATAVTWSVDDVDGTVRALKEKGIAFERYEMPNVKHEGDVHVFGEIRNAWFKDPDGNILSIVSR